MKKTQKGTLIYEKGETIIKEGEKDKTIFFLVSGKVGIYKGGKLIGVVDKPNSPLGEISAILGSQRTASCVALDRCEVVAYRGGIDEIIKKYPKTTKAIIRNLAERVAKSTGELAKMKAELKQNSRNSNLNLQKNAQGEKVEDQQSTSAEGDSLENESSSSDFSFLAEISQPDFAKVLKFLTEKELAILVAQGDEKLKERLMHFMSQRRLEAIQDLINSYSQGISEVELATLREKLKDIIEVQDE